jgi:hypothetical protein
MPQSNPYPLAWRHDPWSWWIKLIKLNLSNSTNRKENPFFFFSFGTCNMQKPCVMLTLDNVTWFLVEVVPNFIHSLMPTFISTLETLTSITLKCYSPASFKQYPISPTKVYKPWPSKSLQSTTWPIGVFTGSFHRNWHFTACLRVRLEMCNLQTICKCKWHNDPPHSKVYNPHTHTHTHTHIFQKFSIKKSHCESIFEPHIPIEKKISMYLKIYIFFSLPFCLTFAFVDGAIFYTQVMWKT